MAIDSGPMHNVIDNKHKNSATTSNGMNNGQRQNKLHKTSGKTMQAHNNGPNQQNPKIIPVLQYLIRRSVLTPNIAKHNGANATD